jgi:hypothetical protein
VTARADAAHVLPDASTLSSRGDRRALVLSSAIAGVAALLLVVVVPRGGDAAAHLYRTLLVQHGALLWDNLWFAGQYPLVSYSLVYYLPAALVGNTALGALGVVCSAVLFASLVLRAFPRAGRWPAYWFAVVAGGQFFTGDYPYTAGFTALLATLVALQRGRTLLGVVCAALTLGFSPLAFLFLCLALLALWLNARQPWPRTVVLVVSLAALAGIQLGALALFPSPGLYYPFSLWRLVLGVPVGLIGAALSLRSRAARPLAWIFGVWTIATIAAYVIPSPVGHNLLRPATIVFPLMFLAAVLAGHRPRWLAYPALVAAFAANFGPYVATVISRSDRAAHSSFWTPLLAYVRTHSSTSYRLEVVPTINHWEAYYVPKDGFAIARGWYQQLDSGDNPRVNRPRLSARVYDAWLRGLGVRYVVDAHDALAPASRPEGSLLASGRSGLVRVFHGRSGDIFAVPHAVPILTGPRSSAITGVSFSSVEGWTRGPGVYLLRIHYTKLWRLARGAVCPRPGPGGMTRLDVLRAGSFTLRATEGPGALAQVLDDGDTGAHPCRIEHAVS